MMTDRSDEQYGDLEPIRSLLAEVFPDDEKFRTREYLRWLYEECPSGAVIESNTGDGLGLVGHYAVVPQRWRLNGADTLAALSLNTAVSERARGQGLFTRLAEQAYSIASERGVGFIVGVANANSTPGFAGRLGFSVLGPLDVRIFPGWGLLRTTRVPSDRLSDFTTVIESGEGDRRHDGTRRSWTVEELRWRLGHPGAEYAVRDVGGALVVSTVAKFAGVRVSVILKVFVGSGRRRLSSIARTVARADRACGAVYAGTNPELKIGGIVLPMRLRPSPLNLIVRDLTGEGRVPNPDVFEFLDFDAY